MKSAQLSPQYRRNPLWSAELSSSHDAFYDLLFNSCGPGPVLYVAKNSVSVLSSPLPNAATTGRIVDLKIEIDQSNPVICACILSNQSHATLITGATIQGSSACTLSWWNIQSGELIARTHAFQYSVSKAPITLSASNHSFLAATNGFTISIFGSAGEEVHELPTDNTGSASTVSAMIWLRQKGTLFAAVANGHKPSICSWTVDGEEMKQTNLKLNLPDGSASISQLLISSDDKIMAALCGTKVLIWNMASVSSNAEDEEMMPQHTIERSNKRAFCFAWAEGRAILAISFGKDLVLWEQTMTADQHDGFHCLQLVFERRESAICSIVFQKGGDLLAAMCDDGRLLIFDTRPKSGLRLLESHMTSIPNSVRPSKLFFTTARGDICLCLVAHSEGLLAYHIEQVKDLSSSKTKSSKLPLDVSETRDEEIRDTLGQERGPSAGGGVRREGVRSEGYGGRGGRGRGPNIYRHPSPHDSWHYYPQGSSPHFYPNYPNYSNQMHSGLMGSYHPATGDYQPSHFPPTFSSHPSSYQAPILTTSTRPESSATAQSSSSVASGPSPHSSRLPSSDGSTVTPSPLSFSGQGSQFYPPTHVMSHSGPAFAPMAHQGMYYQPDPAMQPYYSSRQVMQGGYPMPYPSPSLHYGQEGCYQGYHAQSYGRLAGVEAAATAATLSAHSMSTADSSIVTTPSASRASTPRLGSFRSIQAEGSSERPPPPPPPPPPVTVPVSLQSQSAELTEEKDGAGEDEPPALPATLPAGDDNESKEVHPNPNPNSCPQHLPYHNHHQPTSYVTRYPPTTVYVGNLTHNVDEGALFNAFIHFGFISEVQIIRDRETGIHKGYGFVTFASSASGVAAIQYMNGCRLSGPFQGLALKVSPSHQKVKTYDMPGISSSMHSRKELDPGSKSSPSPDSVDLALSSLNTLSLSSAGPVETQPPLHAPSDGTDE